MLNGVTFWNCGSGIGLKPGGVGRQTPGAGSRLNGSTPFHPSSARASRIICPTAAPNVTPVASRRASGVADKDSARALSHRVCCAGNKPTSTRCAAAAAAAPASARGPARSDAYVSYRGSIPLTASCMAACTMASTRESWTGEVGAVRAVAYHTPITWGDGLLDEDEATSAVGDAAVITRELARPAATMSVRSGMVYLPRLWHRGSTYAVKV